MRYFIMPSNCYRCFKKVCILVIVCITLSAVFVAILVLAIFNNQSEETHLLIGQMRAGVTAALRCHAEGKNVTNDTHLQLLSPTFTMVCEATTTSRGTEHAKTPLSPCFDLTTDRGQHNEQTCSYKKKAASVWECFINFTTQLQRETTTFILIECYSGSPELEFVVEIIKTTTGRAIITTVPEVTAVAMIGMTSSEEPSRRLPAPKSRSCSTSGQVEVIVLSTILTKVFHQL